MEKKLLSSAELFGKGIFTTVAITHGEPFLWEKHWRRLSADAAKIGIELSRHSGEATRRALAKEIANSGLTDGRARVTFSDESPSRIWSTEGEKKTGLSIIVAE